MAVICLVGGRLFDHLYPSPPWAFHHLHLTNYSIRVKVGNAHAVAQATTSASRHCSLLAVLLALTPPPSLLRSSPLCLTYAPALSFLCPSRFGVAMRDEWGVAPVLCWPGFTATAHRLPSAHPYIGLSLHPSHPLVGRGGLTLHAIPHIVSI